jgi:hypothetical protein
MSRRKSDRLAASNLFAGLSTVVPHQLAVLRHATFKLYRFPDIFVGKLESLYCDCQRGLSCGTATDGSATRHIMAASD